MVFNQWTFKRQRSIVLADASLIRVFYLSAGCSPYLLSRLLFVSIFWDAPWTQRIRFGVSKLWPILWEIYLIIVCNVNCLFAKNRCVHLFLYNQWGCGPNALFVPIRAFWAGDGKKKWGARRTKQTWKENSNNVVLSLLRGYWFFVCVEAALMINFVMQFYWITLFSGL